MVEFTIRDIVSKINARSIVLPVIQRKFVWKEEQIISLFDSILKGYPIGIFLFWELRNNNNNNSNNNNNNNNDNYSQYQFYEFITYYTEGDFNPRAAMENAEIAVLDGQQRLESFYIGLMGTYTAITRRGNSITKQLYLNPLKSPQNIMEEDYEFKFLADNEANNDKEHFWFPVNKILNWNEAGALYKDRDFVQAQDNYINRYHNNNDRQQIIGTMNTILTNLWNIIHKERFINAYMIEQNSMDEVLEIFERINSGGTKLSKSDLLFSIIVANWNDARERIEELLRDINNNGFDFDTDFVLKACLFLNNLPIELKVASLNRNNIETIQNNWEATKKAIRNAVDLIEEFRFTDKTLTSNNAVIPIAHYYFRRNNRNIKREEKENIRQYLIRALVKQIFGSHSDSVLERIRTVLNQNGDIRNNIRNLLNTDLEQNKSFRITEEDIEQMLNYSYSNQNQKAHILTILSLLYSNNLDDRIQFHLDHIHPRSAFTEYPDWNDKKDKLPNLQLLEGRENQERGDRPFKNWLKNRYQNDEDRNQFLRRNFIPTDIDLSIDNFNQFFDKRKEILREELRRIFGVNQNDQANNPMPINQSQSEKSEETSNINENYTGRRVSAFIFNNTRYEVRYWKDVLLRVCEIVLNQNNNNDITQLSRRFSKDHQEFEQYESISSGEDYIYVNLRGLNANYIVNLTKQVLRYFGYDPDRDFRIITEELSVHRG